MAASTPRGLNHPTSEDKIKDGSSPSALADDFAVLASSADAAITAGVQEAKDDATTKYGGLPARVTTLEKDKWLKPDLPSGTDLNTLTTPGSYEILGVWPNVPSQNIGNLTVLKMNNTALQVYTTWETVPRTFYRQRDTGGTWFPWAASWNAGEVAANVDVNTLTTPGVYNVPSGNATNLPIPALGSLQVLPTSFALVQTYTAWALPVRTFARRQSGGVWAAWYEIGVRWDKGNLSASTSLDSLTVPGAYSITSGNNPGLPVPMIGTLEMLTVSSAFIQRFTTWETVPRTWTRRKLTNGTWDAWRRNTDTVKSSSFKTVPLSLTLPGTTVTEVISDQSVRWPIKYAVPLNRWRLHIRNTNFANGNVYSGAINITGVWVGPGSNGVFTSTPVKVHGAFSTPANGDDSATAWISESIPQDIDYMVSIGFTAGATQTIAINQGGSWRSASSADASAITSGAVKYLNSPLDVWLEAEVAAATPILGGFGDSMTVGTNSTLPVFDSWLSKYCRDTGALPYHLAQHGSAAANWSDGNHPKWHRWDDLTKPDAVIDFLGQNDIKDGVTLSALQSDFLKVLELVREQLSTTVYAATITPADAKTGPMNDVRLSYNTWLKTLPGLVRDCLDFAGVVTDVDGTLNDAYNADGIHLNTAGNTALSEYVKTRRVTPDVLTPGQIVALKALL